MAGDAHRAAVAAVRLHLPDPLVSLSADAHSAWDTALRVVPMQVLAGLVSASLWVVIGHAWVAVLSSTPGRPGARTDLRAPAAAPLQPCRWWSSCCRARCTT